MGVGILELLPTSIWGEINGSLSSAVDRYTFTVSVPDLYNSVGRQAVGTLKEEADLERHKTWLAWDQARRNNAAANAATQKAKKKDNWRKATTKWDDCGSQPSCGYKSIAKKHSVCPTDLKRYKDGEYYDSTDSALVADSGGDDSGEYDS